MQTKQVYQLDSNGIFIGVETSHESPLEAGKFLIPAGCVEIAPPDFVEGQFAQWNGKEFEIKDIPPKVEPEKIPEPIPPTPEEIEAERVEAEIQAEIRAIAIERIALRQLKV